MTEPFFDSLAADYDRRYAETAVGRLQRAQVWRQLNTLWQAGDSLVELGCGTGIDAAALSARSIRVLATDISPAMVEVARRRCGAGVRLAVLAAEQIGMLDEHFDGAFSNFAALNCILDLDAFARDLASRLRPGAKAAFCFFGRTCLWEILGYLVRGSPRKAFRRRRSGTVLASIGGGTEVAVRYYSPDQVKRAFTPWFRLIRTVGIGVSVPPTYLDALVQRTPRLFKQLSRLDQVIGSYWPAIHLGDHTLYLLECL
ncbi:MAG: methyltransferase domain-containing protein [Gemmatimonadaceae bacterium]|nr:methyltransferase domain-containing protein [Gloeobacterales cyanobacterium ES-bin-141]